MVKFLGMFYKADEFTGGQLWLVLEVGHFLVELKCVQVTIETMNTSVSIIWKGVSILGFFFFRVCPSV